jgi:hypothetical protein
MNLTRTIWLGIVAATALTLPGLLKADPCGYGNVPSNCYFSDSVVYVDYGVLTLLSPSGGTLSTTDLVTAETGLGSFDTTPPSLPAGFVGLFPGLVPQLESDPQSTFAELPSYLYSGLLGLADANGFGLVQDPAAPLNEPPDPAVVAFDAELADVGGPYITTSDTGFQTQPYSPADCAYENTISPGLCTGPPPPGVSQYTFTYQLGPTAIDDNTYTSFVTFQIYSHDVTEQLIATPEPSTLLPLGMALLIVSFVKYRTSTSASRRR